MKKLGFLGVLPFVLLVFILFLGLIGWGSGSASVLKPTDADRRPHTVIIDAGHGGIDGGATSCSGVLESHINLQIAHVMDDLFQLLGYRTLMIRTTDESVYTEGETIAAQKVSDLKNRVNVGNTTENAVYLSIHQNTFSDSRYGGAQVFYGQDKAGKTLADNLQKVLIDTLNPGSNRSIKKAKGVYLMEHLTCTAVLIECGFLSNPEEEALLRSKNYQQKLCCVIASTVSAFLSNT